MRASILVTAALFAFVSKANAVPVTLEFSGTADGFGNFSLTDNSICNCDSSNVPFSLTYKFNVPAGATSYTNDYQFGFGTPTSTATIVFPTISFDVPDYPGGAFEVENDRQESITLSAQMLTQTLGYHADGISYISTSLAPPLPSLFSSLSMTGIVGGGQFEISEGETGGDFGSLIFDSLVLNGGAPEPSTWTMLILGFAAIGLAGWRRQRMAS